MTIYEINLGNFEAAVAVFIAFAVFSLSIIGAVALLHDLKRRNISESANGEDGESVVVSGGGFARGGKGGRGKNGGRGGNGGSAYVGGEGVAIGGKGGDARGD